MQAANVDSNSKNRGNRNGDGNIVSRCSGARPTSTASNATSAEFGPEEDAGVLDHGGVSLRLRLRGPCFPWDEEIQVSATAPLRHAIARHSDRTVARVVYQDEEVGGATSAGALDMGDGACLFVELDAGSRYVLPAQIDLQDVQLGDRSVCLDGITVIPLDGAPRIALLRTTAHSAFEMRERNQNWNPNWNPDGDTVLHFAVGADPRISDLVHRLRMRLAALVAENSQAYFGRGRSCEDILATTSRIFTRNREWVLTRATRVTKVERLTARGELIPADLYDLSEHTKLAAGGSTRETETDVMVAVAMPSIHIRDGCVLAHLVAEHVVLLPRKLPDTAKTRSRLRVMVGW